MAKVRRFIWMVLCVFLVTGSISDIQAAEDVSQRTVRVGFFSADGYHVMDEDGTMSGYGYDFLQMLLRYDDWSYEYVGYDKNWGDMLDMLDDGEIDMVTLANKTPEREEKFDYSEKSIGTSSSIMTVSADNDSIIPGEYDTYDGAVVGLVEGSSHNEKFEEYAREKGFSYTVKYYEDIALLLEDLRANQNIDIAVTSNMRQVQDEMILDEFNATEYYAIVKKGNEELLAELNKGIEQLSVYTPDWRTALFQKYYSDINSKVISLSVDEREYLAELASSGTVIKAAINPELKPYSYFENGEAKGIAPVLFEEVASRLGLKYEILESKDRWEYKEQLDSGEADIDLTAFLDYSLAQRYNLKETDAYINSTLAMLTTKDSNTDPESMVVAVVRDPTEYIGYNSDLIDQYQNKEYESIAECIEAVKNGEADATFRYVYIAEQAVMADYTNRLQYTIMQDYTFGLAIGVNNELDHRLLSVLNKSVNSINDSFAQSVMLSESTNVDYNSSLIGVAFDHPVFVVLTIVVLLVLAFMLILMAVRNRAQKNQLLATREMDRFIGYVCESYETVTEINIETRIRIIYQLMNGTLQERLIAYEKFDRDYFSDMVREEDVDRMAQMFSDENIEQMIAEGGSERYFECQVKNQDGEYNWYSYLIKAVPKDLQHPKNYVVFKKNIQEIKIDEEQQKQVLKDALQTAQSASAAKGQFLSKMSHEIRTPLNAVIGYMQIARDSADDPSKMMHCVTNSDMAAKHLLSIINDVLDISSIESGKMKIAHEEFDLKKQITSLTTIFYNQAKEKKVHFDVMIDSVTQEWVIGDSLRVNQILMNLLSNAIKFTPEDGHVSMNVTQVNVDEQSVFMKFRVSDSGIGMSEEYQKRLFQPFEQESAATAQKFGGSGLGLSITNNLINMMGGSIEVTSKPDQGTTFVVSLRFDKSREAHEQDVKPHDYSHVRALIVDDDASTCEYMKALLKRCGVKSDVVRDGAAAIKQIRRRRDTDYRYNLCIMDWNMPGINGVETARKIREEFDDQLPIIIATAYDVTEFETEAKAAGVEKVIAKPLFQSTMFDLLVSTYGKYEPELKEEHNLADIAGLHVLLAEDNPMNLEIAVEILNKAGLTVDTVTDGQQALEQFERVPSGTYDAILMDVQMPVMDGYQATAAIRQSSHPQAATMPIIAMTANAFTEDVNAALASGMNGHISKPVDYDKLYSVLNQFCVRPTGVREDEKADDDIGGRI